MQSWYSWHRQMFGEDALSEFFGEVKAGDEQQAQTAGGAASASTSYARVKDSAADRRISDFFGQARVEARRGAPGVKAGSLADHVHEGGLGLSSESSVLHGNPVPPEAGSIPHVGGAVSASPGRCLPWPCSGNLLLGSTTCGRTRTGSKEVQSMGWLDTSLHWKYQLWNPTLKCLQEDKERKPVPNEEMKQLLEQLYAALKGPVVTRFHCTRKLTEIIGVPSNLLLRPVHQGRGAASLGSHDEASRQLCPAVGWSGLHKECGASSRADGGEDSRDDRAAVRRATTTILGNASNHCYMNSWVQVMLWAIERECGSTTSTNGAMCSILSASLRDANMRTKIPH